MSGIDAPASESAEVAEERVSDKEDDEVSRVEEDPEIVSEELDDTAGTGSATKPSSGRRATGSAGGGAELAEPQENARTDACAPEAKRVEFRGRATYQFALR
jgi:hypothetical protein